MDKIKKITALSLMVILTGLNTVFAQNNEVKDMKKIIQTAGRDALGSFAPEFAHFNDDILFGENWNNNDIDTRTRSIITIVALISQGITDNSLKYHLQNAKSHGITKAEIAAIITNTAFYAGWPKAWAAFNLAKEVWGVNEVDNSQATKESYENSILFPIGAENTAYNKYFIGQSYVSPISTSQVKMYNVTFEPKCRNNWHIHKAKEGGGQILIAIGGRGYYQEWGKPAQELNPGDVVNIPANLKHWHGAATDSWFSHIAVEVDGVETENVWLEPVDDNLYNKLK